MNKIFALLLVALTLVKVSNSRAQTASQSMVLIKTELGNMKLKLYNDTPAHKNNFLKLVNEGYYNGTLFHRVIKNFMIQGGDPESKDAPAGQRLGSGNPGYTIPAEIRPQHFHKKGALAAARKGGPSNPEKRSSGSQFYIVQGEVISNGMLDTLEMTVNNRAKNNFYKTQFSKASAELNAFRKNNDREGFNARVAEIRAETDSLWALQQPFSFTTGQREAYTSIGGYPSLDREYTVFGELVSGFEVLDKIAALETDQYDRPLQDIKITMEVVE